MKIGRLLIATVTAAFAMLTTTISAQDIHFSQFYSSPLNLNPAATGVMSCDMRVTAIYRNQWGSIMGANAYNTFSAGVEGKFRTGSYDYFGVGLNIATDKAGASKYAQTQVGLSASYLKRIGGRRSNEQYLVAGGQIGISQRGFNSAGLQFGDQFTGDGFSGNVPSQEVFTQTRTTFADFNVGLMYFAALDPKGKSTYYVGLAFSHLTRANLALLRSGQEPLYMKYTIHGGGDFRVARRFAVVPHFAVHLQGPSIQSMFGSSFKFDLSKRAQSDQAFSIGAYGRIVSAQDSLGNNKGAGTDALMFTARVTFGSHNVGLSYDVNMSKLKAASRGNGAIELSYVYTMCGGRKKPMPCPTF